MDVASIDVDPLARRVAGIDWRQQEQNGRSDFFRRRHAVAQRNLAFDPPAGFFWLRQRLQPSLVGRRHHLSGNETDQSEHTKQFVVTCHKALRQERSLSPKHGSLFGNIPSHNDPVRHTL
jgi:hypothetical protein